MTDSDSIEEQCYHILENLFGGCREFCDTCQYSEEDFCFKYYLWSMRNISKAKNLKAQLEYVKALEMGGDRVKLTPREEKDVTACCSNCKYSETLSLVNDKLTPTSKFFQKVDGGICHICGENKHSECELIR